MAAKPAAAGAAASAAHLGLGLPPGLPLRAPKAEATRTQAELPFGQWSSMLMWDKLQLQDVGGFHLSCCLHQADQID